MGQQDAIQTVIQNRLHAVFGFLQFGGTFHDPLFQRRQRALQGLFSLFAQGNVDMRNHYAPGYRFGKVGDTQPEPAFHAISGTGIFQIKVVLLAPDHRADTSGGGRGLGGHWPRGRIADIQVIGAQIVGSRVIFIRKASPGRVDVDDCAVTGEYSGDG